jgi:8-amino-7-oxononanoate synthase
MEFKAFFQTQRQNLLEQQGWRELRPRRGLDFCSNDYLGFTDNPNLRERVVKKMTDLSALGSSGSRLLRGQCESVEHLEERLAQMSGGAASLYFPTGYQANLALFSCLLRQDAVIFSDERVHASIIDGIRLSSCEKYIWAHNDLNDLEMLLRQKARSDRMNFVVVESIYSMLGTRAPLSELVDLCQRYGVELIVDEAHATGLYGSRGSGCVEAAGVTDKVFATIHTAGKSLGVSGAWISGSNELKQWMINRSRPFIYSTAPAMYQQLALLESIEFLTEDIRAWQQRFQQRQERMQGFLLSLQDQVKEVRGVDSPITAVILGENEKALKLMELMSEQGVDVRAIRYPSVPAGEALLRITCPLSRMVDELDQFEKAMVLALEDLS